MCWILLPFFISSNRPHSFKCSTCRLRERREFSSGQHEQPTGDGYHSSNGRKTDIASSSTPNWLISLLEIAHWTGVKSIFNWCECVLKLVYYNSPAQCWWIFACVWRENDLQALNWWLDIIFIVAVWRMYFLCIYKFIKRKNFMACKIVLLECGPS